MRSHWQIALPLTFIAVAALAPLMPTHLAKAQVLPCKASLNSLPVLSELKGFQLGMSIEQTKALAPSIVFPPSNPLGVTKTTINPAFDPRAEQSKFQDVRTISLDFLDGHLTSLWIGYDSGFKWKTVEDVVTGISRSLTLPNAWTDWRSRGKQITCQDFEITVSMIGQSPSLRIVNIPAGETLAARRAAAAEADAESQSEESEEVVGDRKTKTYYQGNCRVPDSVGEANRVTFRSAEEAEKAGYMLSKSCS